MEAEGTGRLQKEMEEFVSDLIAEGILRVEALYRLYLLPDFRSEDLLSIFCKVALG